MNTKKTAIASSIGILTAVALLLAYPAMAAAAAGGPQITNQLPTSVRSTRLPSQKIQLSVGQTVTLDSVAGGYWVIGSLGTNGTASGTITLQVTGALSGGYVTTLTGGTLSINGTNYAISGGSAELGSSGRLIVGQGQAGGSQFLFHALNLGKFGSTNYGVLLVDFKAGPSEFAARLLVTISS